MTISQAIRFTKMHGLGNNYVYVNQFEEKLREEDLPAIARAVSDQKRGVGSDGMILICPSDEAPVLMRIFNSDGSEGLNCGNGLRCVAKYAFEHGLVNDTTFHIATRSRVTEATVVLCSNLKEVVSVTIDMGEPILLGEDVGLKDPSGELTCTIDYADETFVYTPVSMGNPHAVFFVDRIDDAPLYTLGKWLSSADVFRDGVNVEFIEQTSRSHMHFRVYERGSGVTEACGTGACAAAVTAIAHGKADRDVPVTVSLAGGDLNITWQSANNHVLMEGPATTVCDGTFYWTKEE
ncbi:MAG: diaminopimelate epimerase [Bacilli bacterium]